MELCAKNVPTAPAAPAAEPLGHTMMLFSAAVDAAPTKLISDMVAREAAAAAQRCAVKEDAAKHPWGAQVVTASLRSCVLDAMDFKKVCKVSDALTKLADSLTSYIESSGHEHSRYLWRKECDGMQCSTNLAFDMRCGVLEGLFPEVRFDMKKIRTVLDLFGSTMHARLKTFCLWWVVASPDAAMAYLSGPPSTRTSMETVRRIYAILVDTVNDRLVYDGLLSKEEASIWQSPPPTKNGAWVRIVLMLRCLTLLLIRKQLPAPFDA